MRKAMAGLDEKTLSSAGSAGRQVCPSPPPPFLTHDDGAIKWSERYNGLLPCRLPDKRNDQLPQLELIDTPI